MENYSSIVKKNKNLHNIESTKNTMDVNLIDRVNKLSKELDETKLENTRVKRRIKELYEDYINLYDRFTVESEEADIYYNNWMTEKNKHIRPNPELKLVKRVKDLITENKKEFPQCPICLEQIEKKDYCVTICGHEFHEHCLDKSLELSGNESCPVCRC